MRLVPLALALVACSDTGTFRFDRECEVGAIGDCGDGRKFCLSDGHWSKCVYPRRYPEVCDGVDNDLDGSIDELEGPVIPCGVKCADPTLPCPCVLGQVKCIHGVSTCVSAIGPTPEVCDGIDNDCDGELDEGLDPLSVEDLEPCYEDVDGYQADTATLGVGVCSPGFKACQFGKQICVGATLPGSPRCDPNTPPGDYDCDGEVDAREDGDPTDIVLLVDTSGSMQGHMSSVRSAARSFASLFGGSQRVRLGLVYAPGIQNEQCELAVRLADPAITATLIDRMSADGAWNEPTLDCPAMVAAGGFGATWRAGARKVIIQLTDEEPQSYRDTPRTPLETAEEIRSEGVQWFGFVNMDYSADWEPLATHTGGALFNLLRSPIELHNDLTTVLSEGVCD